jgi:mRNA-degrading endonuclease RelE of RelBE toxin-antitoxin system
MAMSMDFRFADTFIDSLARLSGDEQKAVKTTAFDLQLNPARPGMSFHKLDRAKDQNFWSVRVNSDIRLIVHRTAGSLLLCYVGHHDKAYDWAERRKLEIHPRTGAAQFVEIRERIEEIMVRKYIEAAQGSPRRSLIFADTPEQTLLEFGVPQEWIADVQLADEDRLLELIDHLPAEASEALFVLAAGDMPLADVAPEATHARGIVRGAFGESPFYPTENESLDYDPGAWLEPTTDASLDSRNDISPSDNLELPSDHRAVLREAFEHPDAQRRFRTIHNIEELERAFAFPWEKWTIFLHPDQRQLIERDYNGPARVSGSAGTGKTIVALHRAAHLARTNPEGRVLLTTFSESLASALRVKLRRLIASEPRLGERIDVLAMDAAGIRLYEAQFGPVKLATREDVRNRLANEAARVQDLRFGVPFLMNEWEQVVDAWQLQSRDEYRDVKRLGRKTRLPDAQRAKLWAIFEAVQRDLRADGLYSLPALFTRLAAEVSNRQYPPYEHVVVDEAQDISVSQLKLLAAIEGDRPNALFFAGDLGQRIFQMPFSWKSLGVDIRGRSRTLNINYRTSHQIRASADRLLGQEVADVDGNVEVRKGTVSVFNGPSPTVSEFASEVAEIEGVAQWLHDRIAEGFVGDEIGVFVRSDAQLDRAKKALESSRIPYVQLNSKVQTTTGKASVCTMQLAKGLEFRAVAVMACDDEVVPLQSRIEQVTDDGDLEEVYATERHLLYVACTRARERLHVSGVQPTSEFLQDLQGS